MGKVINLNKYRKRKEKLEREKQAGVNRRLHGRSSTERAREDLQKRQLTRAVDGAKLDGELHGDNLHGSDLRTGDLHGDSGQEARGDAAEDAPEPRG